MAPVIQALAVQPGVRALVCATAQHREMLDQVFEIFAIRPDVDLNLMQPNQTLPALTALALTRVSPVSYTHLRAHDTVLDLVCRLLLEKNTPPPPPPPHHILSHTSSL